MPGLDKRRDKSSNLEGELYLLIAKFLSTGRCQKSVEVLRREIEEHQLLPKRTDWLGNEHSRTFSELEPTLTHIADDHLLRICSRIGSILDKEIPPTVPGVTSLLGVGRQSLLRTKKDLQQPKIGSCHLLARHHGSPLYPSPAIQNCYPPNVVQTLMARELSGPVSSRHTFSSKLYARKQIYRRFLGHLSSVYCVLFDRTGKYIFTGADDLLVKIWSAVDGRLLAALRGHSAEITDMAVNFENTLLATGSCDKTIRVWCLRTTAPMAVLSAHTAMVTSLQFSSYPNGPEHFLISTGNDGCICFWLWNAKNNAFNPKPLKFTERNKAGAQMICSSFSAGGVFLATGSTDHNVRVYNIAGVNGPEKILERETHTDRVDSLQFSNLDCRFVTGSKDGTAIIWKYERQNWSCISLKMSTRLPGNTFVETEDTKVKLRVTMVGWTLDDSMVITAVSDHSIKVWDSYSGVLRHVLTGHEDEVFVLESHPTDPRVFLSSGHDGRIMLWDLVTGLCIKNYFNLIEGQGHGAVFDCKFSPDGHMFASTDSHGHLCIFGFGSNDRFKKVPEEQFFHTDYRPLIRDINHYVLDEQTQCAPHLLPPPFLVDIDGNPYPPHLQRLVPGREHCNDSQLIPYVAVSAAGDAEILEPVRPMDGPVDHHRPTIDDMIEILQQERVRSGASGNEADGNSSERNSQGPFSPRSSHRSLSENGERSVADSFSPRSTPRGQAGHSRVGMRRTGDIEGVRQSSGNWQSRGNQAEVPTWTKCVVVKPMKASVSKSNLQWRTFLADSELAYYNREKKKRQLPDPAALDFSKLEDRGSRRQMRRNQIQTGIRSRSVRQRNSRNNIYGDDYENPDTLNFSSSSDSETDVREIWDESSGDDSESGEYSDWTADAGLNEKSKRKTKSNGSAARTKRNASSVEDETEDDQDDEDMDEEDEEEVEDNVQETADVSKKKKSAPSSVTGAMKKLPDGFRPPEWLTDVMPHKTPYVPQIGDEIVYFRQGHELYVQAVKRGRIYDIYMRNQAFRKLNLRDQEVAKIEDITFEICPPRLCCLKLSLLNPTGKTTESFVVKYHDMPDVIDFIILRQNYDQAMRYDWKPGDRFRSAIDKAWWLGTIEEQKPLNPYFPDSMFQCFSVRWDNGEREQMSPWDFEPIDRNRINKNRARAGGKNSTSRTPVELDDLRRKYSLPEEEGGSVQITAEERLAMMYTPNPKEWSSFGSDQDCDRLARGFERIMGLSIAEPFTAPVDLNQYPMYAVVVEYPVDLSTIKARVENRYYRRLEAVKFDVHYIHKNALKFNEPGSRIVKQAKCVVELCIKFIDSPYCSDPMILYHEMMEAKQSRSQDSQSELDVLCSESNSDDECTPSRRMKRKKLHQQDMQQNKRLRLENQQCQYNSDSWKQQCLEHIDQMFQWEDSTPFRYPVNNLEYPDYRSIIDIPMDLSTVREKLESNQYPSPTEFCKDMRLIFQNSRNYNTNKKSRIYSMTIRLSASFEEYIRGIISQWKSAIKYEEKLRNNQYVSNRRKPLPIMPPKAIPSTSSSSHPSSSASSSRLSSSQSSSSRHKHDDVSRPGSSRSASSSQTEYTGTSSRSSSCTFNRETNGIVAKRRAKAIKEEDEPSRPSKTLGAPRKHLVRNKLGTVITNGELKKSKIEKVVKKEPSVKQKVSRITKKVVKAESSSNKKKMKVIDSSEEENNERGQKSDAEHSSHEGLDDYEARQKKKQKIVVEKRKLAVHKAQKKLRPRHLHVSRLSRHTRSTAASSGSRILHARRSPNSYSRPVRTLTRTSARSAFVNSGSSASPVQPTCKSPLQQPSGHFTRSRKLSSAKTAGNLRTRSVSFLRHKVPLGQYRIESDSSDSEQVPVTRNSKADIGVSATSSSSFTTASRSKDSNNVSSAASYDHSYSKGRSHVRNSYLDSESDKSENYDDDRRGKYFRSRRSTRAVTRNNTKATCSALSGVKIEMGVKKGQGRIQTRNRGQRTVRYEEDSDEDSSIHCGDSDNAEPVSSISSRGRLPERWNLMDSEMHPVRARISATCSNVYLYEDDVQVNGDLKKPTIVRVRKDMHDKKIEKIIKKTIIAESTSNKRKARIIESSEESNEKVADNDAVLSSHSSQEDTAGCETNCKTKGSLHRTKVVNHITKMKLRKGSFRATHPSHHTRSASTNVCSHVLSEQSPDSNSRTSTRSASVRSGSSISSAQRRSASPLKSSGRFTRSRKLLLSPKSSNRSMTSSISFRRHKAPLGHYRIDSDSSDSEQLLGTQNTKSEHSSSADRSPVSSSASQSKDSNSTSGATTYDPSRSEEHSSSDSKTEHSESDEQSDSDKCHRGQRPTEAVTRRNSKATRSALRDRSSNVGRKRPLRIIQTRNRGQRTVRYKEDSDEEYYNRGVDSEVAEPVPISRRRLRNLSRHEGAAFSD